MITHQKVSQLRIERRSHPQPPLWQATTIAPYSAGRGSDLAVNYLSFSATGRPKQEVTVTREVAGQLERERRLDPPVLVEATEATEIIFRRGEEALGMLQRQSVPAIHLTSSRGCVPHLVPASTTSLAIAAWPLYLLDLGELFRRARELSFSWGAVVPVMFPAEARRDDLARIADLAATNGARYLAAAPVDLDATARRVLASMLGGDDDAWLALFEHDWDDESVDAERLIAKLAAERGLADRALPPGHDARTNWNAAILLAVAGTRLIRLQRDVEAGWTLLRSSKLVAQLHKPVERIAASASLSIIDALDMTTVGALEEWLRTGRSGVLDEIDADWRDV